MSEERLERLEYKVDSVKDDVSELKLDFKAHSIEVKNQMTIFSEHITGDNKIINHISPILEELPSIIEIVKDHQFNKELKKRKMDKLKTWSSRLGIVSLVVGILVGLSRL